MAILIGGGGPAGGSAEEDAWWEGAPWHANQEDDEPLPRHGSSAWERGEPTRPPVRQDYGDTDPSRVPAAAGGQATPHFYRRHTPLVGEIDALTGYDSAGLFAAYLAALSRRYEAKQKIALAKASAVLLEAKFESKGTMPSQAEHERKQVLAECTEDARIAYYRDPEMKTVPGKRKDDPDREEVVHLTVAELENRGRSSPRYKRFLEEQGGERRRWADSKKEVEEAWADFEREQGIVTYLAEQLQDRRSMIFYAGQERRNADAVGT